MRYHWYQMEYESLLKNPDQAEHAPSSDVMQDHPYDLPFVSVLFFLVLSCSFG